jgi:hypothetical protein
MGKTKYAEEKVAVREHLQEKAQEQRVLFP